MSLLRVENLNVRYRTRSRLGALARGGGSGLAPAVCDISFELEAGATLGLVGESGSGKSTLALAIAGLLDHVDGSVVFNGDELVGLSGADRQPYRRELTMMFQDPVGSLSPRMSVASLITEPLRIHRLTDRDARDEAARLLEMVGLTREFAGRYPHQLSGGQARRVGVARALATDPKLLIADEPTAGLDVSVQGEILNLLGRLQRERGLAILIITHNLNVVRHISDDMAIMYLGRFVEQGATNDIFKHAAHPYTEALLSANPTPDPDAEHARIAIRGEVPSITARPNGCEFHPRCPYAREHCTQVVPEQQSVRAGHVHTCHFPLIEAPAKASV